MSAPLQRLSRRALVLAVAGFVLLVIGIVVTLWQWTHPVGFGWFGYAPLSHTVFNPAVNAGMSRPLVVGYCLSVLGALALGTGAGAYVIARRGHR